jgi:hypothetical protein
MGKCFVRKSVGQFAMGIDSVTGMSWMLGQIVPSRGLHVVIVICGKIEVKETLLFTKDSQEATLEPIELQLARQRGRNST